MSKTSRWRDEDRLLTDAASMAAEKDDAAALRYAEQRLQQHYADPVAVEAITERWPD